jgi:hypothetical protein
MTADPEANPIWPALPYRGLNYFRPVDRPLLAGRKNDILECTSLLAHPTTRVLLLHGATGCGKSSFLRAGLIPDMEEQGAGHLFLKTVNADDEALFIRCTEAPIGQIARQVFLFASKPFVLRTPRGSRTLDLSPALFNMPIWEKYLAAASDPEFLLESLREIARIIPQTLVLILDQAEEVLTLNPGQEDFANRLRFFAFLRKFQELEFDARIIVALRTEYYGRFIDATQVNFETTAEFRQFLLGDLSRDALIEAVCRPTLAEEVFPYGIPRDVYGFTFEPHLAEAIVDDILRARFSGPALPILQLVCLGLHENMRAHGSSAIVSTDYAERGNVEGILMEHIRGAIRGGYTTDSDFQEDVGKIRRFLESFYTLQDDNTVVARSRSLDWALQQLESLHLKIAPTTLLSSLTSPSTLILRTIRSVSPGGGIVDEITLGHDFVAIALERWAAKEAELRAMRVEREKDSQIEELIVGHRQERLTYTRIIVKTLDSSSVAQFAAALASIGWVVAAASSFLIEKKNGQDPLQQIVLFLSGAPKVSLADFTSALVSTAPLALGGFLVVFSVYRLLVLRRRKETYTISESSGGSHNKIKITPPRET